VPGVNGGRRVREAADLRRAAIGEGKWVGGRGKRSERAADS